MRLRRRGGGAGSLGDAPQHGWLAEAALCGDPVPGETEHAAMVRLRLEAEAARGLHTRADEMLIEQRER